MPRFEVVAGRVLAMPGDFVEMEQSRAKRFGSRLQLAEAAKPAKKKATKKKKKLHVQPAELEESNGGESHDA